MLPKDLEEWLTHPTVELTLCDACAVTIATDKVIWLGGYTFCSTECRENYREKYQNNPFFGSKPAREHI